MVILSNVIWIDSNIDNKENTKYRKELESSGDFKLICFKDIKESIDYIKTIQFIETKIIISGKLYVEFIKLFIENLKDINVIPKIIIFTSKKELFIENNKQYLEYINHSFYNFGGIQTTFKEIKKFLEYNEEEDNIQMTFEYIDNIEKLALPLFYKTLIESSKYDNIETYTKYLFEKYSKDNPNVYNLLNQIKKLKNIPIELLSKYYIRAYTIESKFYKDINKDLGLNEKANHLSFIKALYEGTKLQSLPLATNNVLYRGAKISNDEINEIKNYLNNKIPNLPASIVFSKSFLSFSKEKSIALKYLKYKNKNDNLSKVLYVLDKDDNIDYSLATHSDIEKISYYPKEREVLFYPFSSFEIKDINEINLNGENIYEIKLLYLGKYLKEIENNQNILENQNNIPESKFKKQLIDFGLVENKKIKDNNIKNLFNEYKNYKVNIKKENKINNIIEFKDNYIIGEFNIDSSNINRDIRIINTFEECNKNSCWGIKNEKEIKENIEIYINNEKIDFSYYYKFKKEGKYQIKYNFKKNLTNTAYLFSGCSSLININLSNFNSLNITNMSYMFYGCESLTNINLSNFNTKNVTAMNGMFSDVNL